MWFGKRYKEKIWILERTKKFVSISGWHNCIRKTFKDPQIRGLFIEISKVSGYKFIVKN